MEDNNYTKEELEEAISNFLESCHRVGKHDIDDNIKYFLKENDHMHLNKNEVEKLFHELDN